MRATPLRTMASVASIPLLILALLLAGCSRPEEQAQSLFDEGQALFKAGEYSAMLARFQRILDEYPETRVANEVRRDWNFYRGLLRVEAERLPTLAAQELRRLGKAVEAYRQRRGSYPARLEALIPDLLDRVPPDPWGRAYAYRRRGRGYVIETLGRDGEQGGEEQDRDIRVVDGRLRNAPALPASR